MENSDKSIKFKKQAEEKESLLRKKVKDSICIIGLTAAGTHDFNPIPYESTYPMVIHWSNLCFFSLFSRPIG